MNLHNTINNAHCILLLVFFVSFTFSSQAQSNQQEKKHQLSRKDFKSKLTKQIKAPQPYEQFVDLKDSIQLVQYSSEDRQLKGLLDTRNIKPNKKSKAIVFLHGGFALGYDDVEACKPFTENGYVVFAPSYRGENGNSGYFECFMGEVTDAENAVKWLSKQDFVDTSRIYVFGHSVGGAISLLVSLNNNTPSKFNGSSAGLYIKQAVFNLCGTDNIPFNIESPIEVLFRCPIYTLSDLKKKHFTYIGSDDHYSSYTEFIKKLNGEIPKNIILKEVPGNHFSSLPTAMNEFIKQIESKR